MKYITAFVLGIVTVISGYSFYMNKTTSETVDTLGSSMTSSVWLISSGLPKWYANITDGCASWSSNVLTTTGSACGGGGGGSTLHVDGGGFVYPQTGDYHSAPKYVATSTTQASTFVNASTTQLTVSGLSWFNATSTWASGIHPIMHGIYALDSSGLHLHSNNGTEVALFGAGGGAGVTFPNYTSALLQTGAGGAIAEYAGTSCTNQFTRALSALGIATCESVVASDIGDGDHGFFSYTSGVASLDTNGLTSANVSGAVSDETGSGALVFATSPTFVTPALGTPSSGVGTNLTALNATQLTTGTVPAARVGASHIDTITEIASSLKDGTGACSSGLLCLGGHTHAISTEISGLGTNVATLLATFTSANFLSALTDNLDLGGETSFEIPNGTAPTVDADGEVAVDTTQDQFITYDGAEVDVLFREIPRAFGRIGSTSLDYQLSSFDTGTSTWSAGESEWAGEVVTIRGKTDVGTCLVRVGDGTNWTETVSANSSGASDTSLSNGTFTAFEEVLLQIGSCATSPNYVSPTIMWKEARQ